ncbi:MAG: histidinol-phosphate transaminase [Alphaproteobacteria bacterium]|nr:histidinol-phosphate transaminase [Alphaproteobacteria bacterium]
MAMVQPRPGILTVAPYVGGEAVLPGVERPIRLASNEGALGASQRARAAYRAKAEELHRYPDGGAHGLRAALARRHGLDAERIVLGAGSDELIALLVRAYAGPGDEVLYSRHGFMMYAIVAATAGAQPVAAPERDLTADVDALAAHAGPRTKLAFLANPNNPTGSYLSVEQVRRLRTALPAHTLLVIDAAYAEYVGRNDYTAGADLVEASDNTVMIRTFSKIFGLAALRLGWAYGPSAVVDVLNRLRGPFNVSAAAQAAGIAAVDDQAHVDAARTHNDVWQPWFSQQVRNLGLAVAPSVGNFVLVRFPAEPQLNADAAELFLKARSILVRTMGGYGLPDSLRISIGLESEMRAVVGALANFLRRPS